MNDYRHVQKALFDAATESESIATDPWLGRVVSTPEKDGQLLVPRQQLQKQNEKGESNNGGDVTVDKRQLLWHAALQYHRSRHGRSKKQSKSQQKNSKDEVPKSKRKQMQELDEVITNLSKESYNTNIRKRSLKNIEDYLPSLSESLDHKHHHQQQHAQNNQNSIRQTKQKHCPICSCLLLHLYTSPTTHRLIEIHSGCDTPSSKRKSSLPPYCIGCRSYLVYECWSETYRRARLANFEKLKVPIESNSIATGGDDSYMLQDFRNGRLIVVPLEKSEEEIIDADTTSCLTPRISNSSSEVSGLSGDSGDFLEENCSVEGKKRLELSENSSLFGRNFDMNNKLGRRKGTVESNHHEAKSDCRNNYVEEREDNENSRDNFLKPTIVEESEAAQSRDDAISKVIGTVDSQASEEDLFADLKTPQNGQVSHANSQFASPKMINNLQPNISSSSTTSNSAGTDAKNENQNAPEVQFNHPNNNRPPYKVIDETITFKSPSLAAKQHLQQARLAIASTFSEEFAVFQDYSIKKATATKQIAKCLHKGYELTTVKCDRCEMPMMKRGKEEEVCVSCPAIMKRLSM